MALVGAMVLGPQVVPARAQMASTLGFHIILACLGIAFPTIVLLAEFVGLRRHNETAMKLARRWSQAMAVLVAVGAVTGTVLSFEMGLLWPGLMRRYGEVLGFPFGVEGIFFFLEAIFTAIYLYGWRRRSGWAHFWTGVPIAVSGIFGAVGSLPKTPSCKLRSAARRARPTKISLSEPGHGRPRSRRLDPRVGIDTLALPLGAAVVALAIPGHSWKFDVHGSRAT